MTDLSELERRVRELERKYRELAADSVRARSEVRDELAGLLKGIEAHVDTTVRRELAPFIERLKKLDQIAENADKAAKAADEARDYRARREEREKVERELREKARAEAELKAIETDTALKPLEAHRKYRMAVVTAVTAVIAALIGAAAGSHPH